MSAAAQEILYIGVVPDVKQLVGGDFTLEFEGPAKIQSGVGFVGRFPEFNP
jgi:hypothetical protein